MLNKNCRIRTLLLLPWATAIVACTLGCGKTDGPERISISGSVTYAGQPVAEGEIRFVPAKDTVGPVTLASIADGKYQATSKGGVPVGTHTVQILAYLPDPLNKPEYKGTPAERPRRQYLPVKYNTQSELNVTLESGQKCATKDFTLTK
jgi:hypothetical protein